MALRWAIVALWATCWWWDSYLWPWSLFWRVQHCQPWNCFCYKGICYWWKMVMVLFVKSSSQEIHSEEQIWDLKPWRESHSSLQDFVWNAEKLEISKQVWNLINEIKTVSKNKPWHDKTNKMSVRPAKTQINLGIRPVWSESLLCAQWVAKYLSFLHADSEDFDQTGWMPRLIWVFAGRTLTLLDLSCRGSNTVFGISWGEKLPVLCLEILFLQIKRNCWLPEPLL